MPYTIILSGLIFHQVISYAAKLRSRRRQYESGLKQFGDQMNMVTRTISNPPSANPTPTGTPTGTPSIGLRKLAALNNNNQKMGQNLRMVTGIPDDDNSVFKPSTHVMRREDSALGTMTTATQLRHQELHIHHDDEDWTIKKKWFLDRARRISLQWNFDEKDYQEDTDILWNQNEFEYISIHPRYLISLKWWITISFY